MAGAYGNRTHQEPVSRPLTGFEDRAEHQLLTRSRMMPNNGLRRTYQIRCVGPTGCFTGFVPPIDKAFRIGTPMRKASWTKRFAAGWGERRGAKGDRGGGEERCWAWTGGGNEKSLPMCAAFEKPRSLGSENAAQGCRHWWFRLPARQDYGTPQREDSPTNPPQRGYSPRNRVRQLPQWGQRGRAAS